MAKNFHNKNNHQQQGLLEIIILSFFKAIWWIITLPFRKARKQTLTIEERGYIVKKRSEIENLLKSENIIELKHAVLEADKIVDFKLKATGSQGETFADRLRSLEENIARSLYNEIWQGHKIRNQIAHEDEPRISRNELRAAANKLINYLKY